MKDIMENLRAALGEKILNVTVHSPRRIYVDVNPGDILSFGAFMSTNGVRFATATGLETPHAFEVLYHFSDDPSGKIISIRVKIENKEQPEIGSITKAVPAAQWIEREMWEMLGIHFKGNPDLRRLLLPDDWPEGIYPLRKEFQLPEHEREKEI